MNAFVLFATACVHRAPTKPDVGEPMEIVGVARNGKAGALLVADGEGPLYVEGVPQWPDGVEGLPVVAKGRVVQQRHAHAATVDADGAISQGVDPGSALDTVLQAASWHLVGSGQGVEPGPWTVRFADGNGNVTLVVRAPHETDVAWSYDPVQPAESSSGVYSGGEASSGTLDTTDALSLWERVRRLQADGDAHTDRRELGTGRLTTTTVGGSRVVMLQAGPASEFATWMAGWQRGPD